MNMKFAYVGLVIIIFGGLIFARSVSAPHEQTGIQTSYDTFAQCLSDADAKFYGTFWCPHCKNQKALFNNSKNLPYVECSTPNGQAQTQVCIDAKIESYPTWIFKDGSVLNGEQTFKALADKTSCTPPVETTP